MARQSVEPLARTLAEQGIVVVEDYLPAGTCEEIRSEVEAALEGDGLSAANPEDDYADHVARGEPLVKRRSGERDDGMLDLFNMELRVPGLASFKDDEFVAGIVNGATDEHYTADTVNVYVNRSVTETRGYHADTYTGKFKSFLYLTDVPDESYGPFAYLRGSHDHSLVTRKVSQLVNHLRGAPHTDAVLYDESKATVCTAPRGTLIVANQAGYHRGIPQEPGRERMLATTTYTRK